jgi:hypothetical protein
MGNITKAKLISESEEHPLAPAKWDESDKSPQIEDVV